MTTDLLEQFRRTHLPTALVVDEFGDVEGLVSLTDVIAAIVGELPPDPGEEPEIADAARHFHTLGGLAMLALGRVPSTGDVFERGGVRFEVVDMDGNRVDRVLVTRLEPPAHEP